MSKGGPSYVWEDYITKRKVTLKGVAPMDMERLINEGTHRAHNIRKWILHLEKINITKLHNVNLSRGKTA